ERLPAVRSASKKYRFAGAAHGRGQHREVPMKVFRSMAMFAAVLGVSAWLGVDVESAVPKKSDKKPSAQGVPKAPAHFAILGDDSRAALFTSAATDRTPYWILHAEFK